MQFGSKRFLSCDFPMWHIIYGPILIQRSILRHHFHATQLQILLDSACHTIMQNSAVSYSCNSLSFVGSVIAQFPRCSLLKWFFISPLRQHLSVSVVFLTNSFMESCNRLVGGRFRRTCDAHCFSCQKYCKICEVDSSSPIARTYRILTIRLELQSRIAFHDWALVASIQTLYRSLLVLELLRS